MSFSILSIIFIFAWISLIAYGLEIYEFFERVIKRK